jgi:hypothetical protein
MVRRSFSTLLAAVAVSVPALVAPALMSPSAAQITLDLNFGAPPAPRYEIVPAPRPGYVWAPGAWRPDGRQQVWQEGHWEQARPGYRYVPDRWERYTDNGQERWRHQASRWDRDGDGIPNRYDTNDNRRNDNRKGSMGDRDGDGIPNYRDRDNRR